MIHQKITPMIKSPRDPFRDTEAVFNYPSDVWRMNEEGTLVGDFRISSREKRGHLMNGIDIRYFFVGMIKKSIHFLC